QHTWLWTTESGFESLSPSQPRFRSFRAWVLSCFGAMVNSCFRAAVNTRSEHFHSGKGLQH
ncbi:hypothetical protein MYX75_10140, partial [Acidobacteria bacterium AH-259-A15]|nr:hypothetical protein [Acidobacteria bacterium AH-259-A15]